MSKQTTSGSRQRRLSRATSYNAHPPPSPGSSLHHRQYQTTLGGVTPQYTPRTSPLMSPSLSLAPPSTLLKPSTPTSPSKTDSASPTIFGLPLKYVSLITLAVQNALLTIIMHYSRISTPDSQAYSAASAVLLNELLKGSISFIIALSRVDTYPGVIPELDPTTPYSPKRTIAPWPFSSPQSFSPSSDIPWWLSTADLSRRIRKVSREIFSPDCWKLSIPAILYVIQNNLQFVAASNLDVATFQVTYQMKILTTAAFSVALLHKRLTPAKWLSLLCLAIGVGIVQIQSSTSSSSSSQGRAHDMNRAKGFLAVSAACLTSGLAGVYFEMVLKGSKADLWVRNTQLSLFSLLPAIAPILFDTSSGAGGWFSFTLFRHFGIWAWATVLTQVLGGLITAMVIKYSDNILKGFATSLSIILSFLASVGLFGYQVTASFIIGATVVLIATALYNRPDEEPPLSSSPSSISHSIARKGSGVLLGLGAKLSSKTTSGTPMSPVPHNAPIIASQHYHFQKEKKSSYGGTSPSAIAAALGFSTSTMNGKSSPPVSVASGSLPPSPTSVYEGGVGEAMGLGMPPITITPTPALTPSGMTNGNASSPGYFNIGLGVPSQSVPGSPVESPYGSLYGGSRRGSNTSVAGSVYGPSTPEYGMRNGTGTPPPPPSSSSRPPSARPSPYVKPRELSGEEGYHKASGSSEFTENGMLGAGGRGSGWRVG